MDEKRDRLERRDPADQPLGEENNQLVGRLRLGSRSSRRKACLRRGSRSVSRTFGLLRFGAALGSPADSGGRPRSQSFCLPARGAIVRAQPARQRGDTWTFEPNTKANRTIRQTLTRCPDRLRPETSQNPTRSPTMARRAEHYAALVARAAEPFSSASRLGRPEPRSAADRANLLPVASNPDAWS